MTAIAAVIALSSAPLFAQSIDAPNLTTPAPAADEARDAAADAARKAEVLAAQLRDAGG